MSAHSDVSESGTRCIEHSHPKSRSMLHQLEIRSGSKLNTSFPEGKDKGVFTKKAIRAGRFICYLDQTCDKLLMINDPCIDLTAVLNAKTHSVMYMALCEMRRNYTGVSNIELVHSMVDWKDALYAKVDIKRGCELLRPYCFDQWLTEVLDILTGDTVIGYCYFLHDYITGQSTDNQRCLYQLEKRLLHLLRIDHLPECDDQSTTSNILRSYDDRTFNYSVEMMNKLIEKNHIMVERDGDWVMVSIDDVLESRQSIIGKQIGLFEPLISAMHDRSSIIRAIRISANIIYWGSMPIEGIMISKPIDFLKDMLREAVNNMIIYLTVADVVGDKPSSTPYMIVPTRNDINIMLKAVI